MSIHRETSSVLQSAVARRAVGTFGEPPALDDLVMVCQAGK